MGWNRRSLIALLGVVAVVGSLLVVVPALGQATEDAVRLHLGTDGQYFEYEDARQDLTSRRCEINETNGPLVALDAAPGGRKVGLDSYGIGVKSGGAQGTPCGRVDTSETLTLSVPTSGPLAGRSWDALRLDLELKGNAWVRVEMFAGPDSVATHQLATGDSIASSGFNNPSVAGPDGGFLVTSTSTDPEVACANRSDSGPDSGPNDNCLWTIQPGADFDRVVFTALVGEFSLEGSADFGNDPDYDTLLYVANAAPTAGDDSATVAEGDSVSIDVLANDTDTEDGSPPGGAVTVVSSPENGSTTVNADRSITYTHDGSETTSDSFTYQVSDSNGSLSNTATVTVTVTPVNDPPVIGTPTGSGTEGEGATIDLDVTDPEGLEGLTTSCTANEQGTFTDTGSGTGTYVPDDEDFDGTLSLDCTVTDSGGLQDSVSGFDVDLDDVNDAPVATDDSYTTVNDRLDPGYRTVTGNVTDNDTDVEDGTPPGGSVALNDDVSDGTLILNPDGSFTYTANALFYGTDSFTYTVADSGGAVSNTATVTIGVPLECDENITFGGNGLPLYTIQAEYGGTCPPKVVTFDASGDPGSQFVELLPSTTTPTKYAFLERIEFLPEPADPEALTQIPFTLYYDDVPPFPALGELGGSVEAEFCLVDPRVVSGGGVPVFDIDPMYDQDAEAGAVLPAGETTCIIEASFTTTGTDPAGLPLVKWIYLLYNLGDGWRGAR